LKKGPLRYQATCHTGFPPSLFNKRDREKSVPVSYTKKMDFLTLGELAFLIKSAIQSSLSEEYWVTAEVAQINCNYSSGHCYLDLVEKRDDVTIAKMRATIWASNFSQISNNFYAATGQELQIGMKILMLARVNYHEVHGLSVNIKEIDPRYTLGEMALKRREVIERLTREGLIEKNRQLNLPPVIQKIAVISSVTAAGYGDFLSRLNNNSYGYKFYHRLFQAYMQGEKTEDSIGDALKKCVKLRGHFEVIVIVRGGGSRADLHCFDSYRLARMIALSPIPVFTGIGHERDETVVDRVANRRLITPTAVAEFLIYTAKQFEDGIDVLRHRLITRTRTLVEQEGQRVNNFAEGLRSQAKHYFKTVNNALRNNIYLLQTRALATLKTHLINLKEYEGRLKSSSKDLLRTGGQKLKDYRRALAVHPGHMISIQSQKIDNCEMRINLLDPQNVLRRGFSITFLNGKILKEVTWVKKDDIISTRLYDGSIISTVESTGKDEGNERKEET